MPADSVLAWSLAGAASVAVGSAVATRALAVGANRLGLIDVPNSRSSHVRPTPRGGGLAIVLFTTCAVLGAAVADRGSALLAVAAPALAVAAVSFADDLRPVSQRIRFAVQVAAAAATIAVLGPFVGADLGTGGFVAFGWLAWPLTLLWIAGLTNSFNFMDGIDGIAGLVAAVAGGALAVAAAAAGAPAVAVIAGALAAAAAGFLASNWHPARIFMGDVGSAFVGFLLATLPLTAGPESAPRLVVVVAVALWPFIFDTAFTILRRWRRGENVLRAHRSHLYQRLTIAGASHATVAAAYGGLAAIGGGLAAGAVVASAAWPTVAAAAWAAATALGLMLGTAAFERRSAARAVHDRPAGPGGA